MAKPTRPPPATRSAIRRAGAPRRRPRTAMPALRIENQAAEPTPTPARKARTPGTDRATPAADVAAKMAAQVAMVSGLEAVAISEVRKAREGDRERASRPSA